MDFSVLSRSKAKIFQKNLEAKLNDLTKRIEKLEAKKQPKKKVKEEV